MPIGHVVVVHRGPPAKDVVADEEFEQDRDGDVDPGDLREGEALGEEVFELHRPGLGERLLQGVVEIAEPFVDPDVELHLVPSDDQDHGAAERRPVQPMPVGKERLEHALSPSSAPPSDAETAAPASDSGIRASVSLGATRGKARMVRQAPVWARTQAGEDLVAARVARVGFPRRADTIQPADRPLRRGNFR